MMLCIYQLTVITIWPGHDHPPAKCPFKGGPCIPCIPLLARVSRVVHNKPVRRTQIVHNNGCSLFNEQKAMLIEHKQGLPEMTCSLSSTPSTALHCHLLYCNNCSWSYSWPLACPSIGVSGSCNLSTWCVHSPMIQTCMKRNRPTVQLINQLQTRWTSHQVCSMQSNSSLSPKIRTSK